MAGNGNSMPSHFAGGRAPSPDAIEALSMNAGANPKLRKRTKTGCLTCRKRRIKCGEERPTCNNCIKSKRHCEGYNQRVIFKTPIGDWPGLQAGAGGTLPFHNGMLPAAAPYQRAVPPPINTQDAGFTPLQPRPMQRPVDENGQPMLFSPPSATMPYMATPHGLPVPSPHTPLPPAWTPITPQYGHPMFPQESPMSASTYHSFQSQLPTPLGPPSHFLPSPNIDQDWQRSQQPNLMNGPANPAPSSMHDRRPSFVEAPMPTPGPSSVSQDTEPAQFPFQPPSSYWEQSNVEFISINTNVPQQSQQPQQSPRTVSWSASQSSDTQPVPLDSVSGKL
jgi:hypothetical protein